MNELDKKIEEALNAEDRALMEQFGEQGLFAQTFGVFQGKLGWIAILSSIFMVGLFAGGFYSAWKFLHVSDTNELIRWGGVAWFLLTGVYLMKLWFWMQMETNRVLREVKRVELQMARMQAR